MYKASHRWSRHAGLYALLALFLLAVLLAGCGGGGGGASESATSYAEGPISGFGSVIVNGVRFDERAALIEDEDGTAHASGELKLGTTVEIDGSAIEQRAAGRFARALRIRFGAEIVGPVDSVDAANSSLVVLGQPVDVKSTTVFGDDLPSGLAGIQPDTIVAVHAQFDAATGHYLATRIDARPDAPVFRLRGLVAKLDGNAKTFQIGSEVIFYGNIAANELPNNLADGLRVRVRLQKEQVNGQWVALSVRHGIRRFEDRAEAEVHGMVTSLDSQSKFTLNGIPVDATNARFPDGPVTLGARVEVEGRAENGVLIASKVELEDRHPELLRFELHGAVSELDSAAQTFMLRGVKVNYNAQTVFDKGAAGDLKDGANVEVKGVIAVDRRLVVAVLIRFED